MELMVAMAITTIIVTVLVSITSIALDTWNRSRSELRASRQAKGMIDIMARDFESLITRRGNSNEWLSAIVDPNLTEIGSDNLKSTNASQLIFFTGATDRYNGQLTYLKDGPDYKKGDLKPGDVSCVAYRLSYDDPIEKSGNFKTFLFKRLLINPAPDKEDKTYPNKDGGGNTFEDLLGKPNLADAFNKYLTNISDSTNFVCENIYQFTLTFHVQVSIPPVPPATATTILNVPVTMGKTNDSFKISGTGIVTKPENTAIAGGRITAVEISTTVISDFGVDQIKRRNFSGNQKAEFLAKNSYQYTKLVQLPGM